MAAAVFGLIGVVVGGILNGVVSAWLERRKQRADARSAARLVQGELVFFRAAAREMGRHSPVELPQLRHVTDALWQSNRAVLSHALPDRAWQPVQSAYAEIDAFLSLMVFEPDGQMAEWRVAEARRVAAGMSEKITRAVEVLGGGEATHGGDDDAMDPRLVA